MRPVFARQLLALESLRVGLQPAIAVHVLGLVPNRPVSDLSRSQERVAMPYDVEVPLTRWQKFRLVVKVVELRLRFVALMAVTGLVFAYWDTLWNYYEKYTRPQGEHVAASSGFEFFCPMHPSVVQEQPGNCPICGMPLSKRKKGEKTSLPEGVASRVQLAPYRIAQAGIRTAEAVLRSALREPDDRRLGDLRRAAAGPDLLEAQGDVSGREARRQLHRHVRRGGRRPGGGLQPRALPGRPRVAPGPGGARECAPPAAAPWDGRCSEAERTWSAWRPRNSGSGA